MGREAKLEFVFDTDNEYSSAANQDDFFAQAEPAPRRRRTSTARRTVPTSFSDIEFNEPVKRSRKRATGPKVSYTKSPKKKKRKSLSSFEWTWNKVGWIFCAGLVLRLFLMESGVIDYHHMNQTLNKKQKDLESLRIENAGLIKEIHKIRTSPSYQKKLARDHLGVIAKDEYLVLFGKDSHLNITY